MKYVKLLNNPQYRLFIFFSFLFIYCFIFGLTNFLSFTYSNIKFSTNFIYNDNVITIITSVFSSVIALISIIFLYYSFIKKSSIKILSDILLKIEEHCELFRLKNNKQKEATEIAQILQKNPQYTYKAPFAILSSYFGQYQQEYNTLENNYKFLSLLFYANCLISAFAFLILIAVFAIVNYLNIFSTAISVIIFLLLAFNCYLSERTLSEVKEGFKFPSPQDLLSPDYILDKYCSEIFGINKYLPLILFHTSTSIAIRPTSEIKDNPCLQGRKDDFNKIKFYIMINSCFEFHVKNIHIHYFSFKEELYDLIFQQTNHYENSYKIAILPKYSVYNQFSEKSCNNISSDNSIYLEIRIHDITKCLLVYRFAKNYSSSNYQLYVPTLDLYSDFTPSTDNALKIYFGIYNL